MMRKGVFRSGRMCLDPTFTLKEINEKKQKVDMGFMDLENQIEKFNRVNKRPCGWPLKYMMWMGDLNRIKSMYVNILAWVRVVVS